MAIAQPPRSAETEDDAVLYLAGDDADAQPPQRPCPYCARRHWELRRLSAAVRAWVCAHCYPPRSAAPSA